MNIPADNTKRIEIWLPKKNLMKSIKRLSFIMLLILMGIYLAATSNNIFYFILGISLALLGSFIFALGIISSIRRSVKNNAPIYVFDETGFHFNGMYKVDINWNEVSSLSLKPMQISFQQNRQSVNLPQCLVINLKDPMGYINKSANLRKPFLLANQNKYGSPAAFIFSSAVENYKEVFMQIQKLFDAQKASM